MDAVWPGTVVGDDALTGCVRDLRKVLGDEARTPHYIETVHGRGYRFIAAVTAAPIPSSGLRVPSQEEGISSQSSVIIRQEQSATEQEVSSVMPAQAGIQGPKAP